MTGSKVMQLVLIDITKRWYEIRANGGTHNVSWVYARAKAHGVQQELRGLGLAIGELNGEMGTPGGANDYIAMCAVADNYYSEYGLALSCLLHHQFTGLEGKYVECVNKDNKTERFFVGVRGLSVPMHVKARRAGGSFGRRIQENFASVKVIEYVANVGLKNTP